ncbi:MAG: nitrate reductase associated protein [Phormidesmis sp. CAN_BIN36]|nr:nitrate reductase associated protein [Phormidesmis sp. CAN_BIN36]
MEEFFQFEADFVESLRCVPMQVRLKLDTCGVKLKLPQWNKFNQDDRQLLVETSCTTAPEIAAYREQLHQMISQRTGETATDLAIDPHPDWENITTIPKSVQEKAQDVGVTLSLAQWESLTPLRRFALIKLSLSGHENHNFLPALKEFRLA